MRLWNKNTEREFFKNAKESHSINNLFYKSGKYKSIYYFPKNVSVLKDNLRLRNLLFNHYCQNWLYNLFTEILKNTDLHVVFKAQIPSIGIYHKSPVDMVIASKNQRILMPGDVKVIFDVNMSVVWNWQYDFKKDRFDEIGDYRTHQGKPGFTNSVNVLNSISKCVDIRLSNIKSFNIPLIVLGNTPLSYGFCKKADFLKSSGIIQGFWSLNPFPVNDSNTKKTSHKNAFLRFDNSDELYMTLNQLFKQELNFFAGMENPENLGRLIEIADKQDDNVNKGLKFLNLLKRS